MERPLSFQAQLLNSSTPGYEIWFAVIIERKTQKALWVRYTTLRPTQKAPMAVIWASLFDAQVPTNHCSGTEIVPLSALTIDNNHYSYPNGQVSLNRLTGKLTTSQGLLSWDLHYQHQAEALDYTPSFIPASLKGLLTTHSTACSPFAQVTGNITLNAQSYPLNTAQGLLTHIWGSYRVEKLYWIFVPQFDNDASIGLELAIVQPKAWLPAIVAAKLRNNRELLHSSSIVLPLTSSSFKAHYPYLEVKTQIQEYTIQVQAKMNQSQTTAYIYRDPDGKPRYIEQSDVSEVSCQIKNKTFSKELHCQYLAAVEFHSLSRWSDRNYLDPYR